MFPLALLGAIPALFKTIYGVGQTIGGNKNLKNLDRPTYEVSPEITQNRNLAGQIASQGLPDSSKNFYTDSIERGLGSTISSAERTGAGLGAVQDAYSTSTDAFRNLLALDANAKMKNQQVLMDANKDLADQKLRAFDYNQNIPYQQAYNKYTQQTNSGSQNIFGGLEGLASAFTGGIGGGQKVGATTGNGTANLQGGMSGFQNYQQPVEDLGLGNNNWQYGLPNYNPLFGG